MNFLEKKSSMFPGLKTPFGSMAVPRRQFSSEEKAITIRPIQRPSISSARRKSWEKSTTSWKKQSKILTADTRHGGMMKIITKRKMNWNESKKKCTVAGVCRFSIIIKIPP